MQILKHVLAIGLTALLVACGGGGGSAGTNPNATTTPVVNTPTTVVTGGTLQVQSLVVQTTPTLVASSGGTGSSLISIYAIDSSNALVSGAVVNLAVTGGILSAGSATTSADGRATVTFTPGFTDQSNRIAVITATSNGKTAVGQVTVAGGSLALSAGSLAIPVAGTAVLTATVRDLNGIVMAGVPVSFSSSNPALLGVSVASGVTGSGGTATVIVSGLSGPGSASINVSALGTSQALSFSTTVSGSGFYFISPANGAVVTVGTGQLLRVQATGVGTVTFATTLGVFSNNLPNQTVAVVAGEAQATLTSAQAGQATVQVVDKSAPTTNASTRLVVSQPVSAANKLLLNGDKTVVPVSDATTQNTIRITARAVQIAGSVDQPVANVPVLFTLTGGPGGGEYLTSALGYSDAAGFVTTTFVAGVVGSIPSGTSGLRVHAQILGTSVSTGVSPSGDDLLLTIGGKALSVAFGGATTIAPSTDNTTYKYPFSVQVTDANGNGVEGATVTLSVKPYAFSLGTGCAVSATYCSEDLNGNGSRDPGEDGTRISLSNNLSSLACTGPTSVGTLDGILTPTNSEAGSVPATLTTAAAGVAPFDLTYLKARAIWMVVKLTATVNSNGTEASASTIFRLPTAEADVNPTCLIPPSPFVF